MSLDVLSELSDIPIRMHPGENYKKVFDAIAPEAPIRWRHAIPKARFDAFLTGMLDDIRILLDRGCVAYHTNVFRRTQGCLRALEKARILPDRLETRYTAETNPTNRSALLSFRPGDDGMTVPVRYDRTATVTGRLTTRSGPRILTLPKWDRDIIVSTYEGGKIVSLDYSSLEPRIAMLAMGQEPPRDVYAHVCESIMGGTLTRKQAKIVTIALIYGAAETTISSLSGLRNGDLRAAIDSIMGYFRIRELQDKLRMEFEATGRILSYYGRPIKVDDVRKIVNFYCQSSAVDAPLLGFMGAIDLIRSRGWLIRPLFSIHDAMMFDVHPDYQVYLEDVRSQSERVPGFSAVFPVKCEEIDGTRRQ